MNSTPAFPPFSPASDRDAGPEAGLRRAFLAVTLVVACLTGYVTTYVLLLLVIAASAVLAARRVPPLLDFAGLGFMACFAAMAIALTITAQDAFDVALVANFAAFIAYIPLATLYRRAAKPGNTALVAMLSLGGAFAGFAFAVIHGPIMGADRAGWVIFTDPIRLAGTCLILGFLALIGFIVHPGRWRWIFMLGPVFALVTILLAGSRGALLAFPPLALVATLFIVRHKLTALGLAGAGIAVLLGLLIFTDLGEGRAATVLSIVPEILSGRMVVDIQTAIRIDLYRAGWEAFLASPFAGHGWARLMSAVVPYLDPANASHAYLPHLHNDLLTLAVAAGVFGIAVYFALLAIPPIAVLRSPRDSQYEARMFGVSILVTAYVVMGLPDTMLSFELHSALYVATAAVLLAFCRDDGTSR